MSVVKIQETAVNHKTTPATLKSHMNEDLRLQDDIQ